MLRTLNNSWLIFRAAEHQQFALTSMGVMSSPHQQKSGTFMWIEELNCRQPGFEFWGDVINILTMDLKCIWLFICWQFYQTFMQQVHQLKVESVDW